MKSVYPDWEDELPTLQDDRLGAALSGAGDSPELRRIPRYQAEDALLKDVLADICEILSLDAYVTSGGPFILPEGQSPREGLEIWMVIRKAGE